MQLDRAAIVFVLAFLGACQREAVTPEVIMVSAEAGAADASPTIVASHDEPANEEPPAVAEIEDVTPPPAAPAGPSGPCGANAASFDRGAAARALGSVNVLTCKRPGGPTGSGHLKVTYAPSGAVSSATVDSGPFPGTPVGACIALRFRSARVPAFCGGPVTVGKSFTLN
jgi:hypothetical protein